MYLKAALCLTTAEITVSSLVSFFCFLFFGTARRSLVYTRGSRLISVSLLLLFKPSFEFSMSFKVITECTSALSPTPLRVAPLAGSGSRAAGARRTAPHRCLGNCRPIMCAVTMGGSRACTRVQLVSFWIPSIVAVPQSWPWVSYRVNAFELCMTVVYTIACPKCSRVWISFHSHQKACRSWL